MKSRFAFGVLLSCFVSLANQTLAATSDLDHPPARHGLCGDEHTAFYSKIMIDHRADALEMRLRRAFLPVTLASLGALQADSLRVIFPSEACVWSGLFELRCHGRDLVVEGIDVDDVITPFTTADAEFSLAHVDQLQSGIDPLLTGKSAIEAELLIRNQSQSHVFRMAFKTQECSEIAD